MYTLLTYPLDVIKTNRILQTSLAKEGAEQIPREILALQEKGGLQRGLFRGFLAGFLAANFAGPLIKNSEYPGFMFGSMIAFVSNPLQIVMIHKQVMNGSIESKTYKQILRETMKGNPVRLFTLGIIPSIIRNITICTGFLPAFQGITYTPVTFIYALGGILLSHPFEVARVMIQHQEKSRMFGKSFKVIRGIYATEGLSGLYRGCVPRTINVLPALVSCAIMQGSDNISETVEN